MARRRLSLGFALATLLAACSTAPGGDEPGTPAATPPVASAPGNVPLEAFHWDLASASDPRGAAIATLQPLPDRPLRLDFSQGRLGVSGGCNRIGGAYQREGDALRVGPLMQTGMACADRRLMDLDAAIAARLQGTLQASASAGEPPRLVLTAANGDTLAFTGTPTPQTRYGSEGTTVFLEVAPQRQPCSQPLIPDRQCLQVRERTYAGDGTLASQGEWQPLYQQIEGYTHVPGTRNVLRVKRFAVRNPPADGASVAYVLDMVVESELVDAR
jgi:heat shock protein HslJ